MMPHMPAFTVSAVLFDLDGVLLDSTAAVEHAWTEWADEHGLDAAEVIAKAHGRPTVETVADVAPSLDARAETDRIEEREVQRVAEVHAHDGARKLLEAIPEGRWAIVTSGTRRLASSRLEGVGLPIPEVFVTADDITAGKPAPDCYVLAADRLGFSPQDCLVVEDAPVGVAAAKAAGIPVIAVATTYERQDVDNADVVVPGVAALAVEPTSNGALRVHAGE